MILSLIHIYYDIELVYGKLEVTPVTEKITVTIKGHTETVKYDGDEHSVTGYDVTIPAGSLYTEKDITFSGKAEAKGTDADTYNMGLKAENFANSNGNFANVEFVVKEDGKLTITKRDVTLTSADAEKVYDGTALLSLIHIFGVGRATITHTYYRSGWKHDTATIIVTADPITGVTLTGENEVKLFGRVQLTANLQPATGAATLTWESSDESILTVDETGMVTGRKLGAARITVWAVDHAGNRFSAVKEITVIQATTTEDAQFYYLTTPTADPKSNDTSVWGRNIGTCLLYTSRHGTDRII